MATLRVASLVLNIVFLEFCSSIWIIFHLGCPLGRLVRLLLNSTCVENEPRRDVPHPLLVLVLYPRRIRFRFQLEIQ